ncbi:MAG: hypothetical protein ACKOAS_03560 [Verrucomicrobiota bacterium]
MTPPRMAQILLAALVAISLAFISPAKAIDNPAPSCCCKADNSCKEHSPKSSCACTGCPVTIHAQPLAMIAEKNQPLPDPVCVPRWNPKDERADERRAAPVVPPPRIPA